MKIDFSFRRYFDQKHSKYEKNISPGVTFEEVPDEAETLAVIMDDPDAPGEGAFTHWIIWNIPAGKDLPEGLSREKNLSFGAKQGNNDFDEIGYGGPKPPKGERHEYRIRAYAVDTEFELRPGIRKKQLTQAVDGHVVDKAEEKIPYKRDLDDTSKAL